MASFTVSIATDTLGSVNSECDAVLAALDAVKTDFGRNRGSVTSGDAAAHVGVPHVSSASWSFTP
jgi:hypothetical protein